MPRRAMLQDARASASDPAVICSFDYEAIDKTTRAIIHQAARFLYVKRGRGKLVIDGEEYVLQPNTLVAITPWKITDTVEVTETLQFIKVIYDYSYLNSVFKSVLGSGDASAEPLRFLTVEPVAYLDSVQAEYVDGIMEHLKAELGVESTRVKPPDKPFSQLYTVNKLIDLMVVYRRYIMSHRGELDSGQKETVKDQSVLSYIYAHSAEKLTLSQVAEAFFLSESALSKQIAGMTGTTFSKLLSSIRVEKASDYLIYTDLTLDEIAGLCGFVDASHVSKHFAQRVGITPMQYRKIYSKAVTKFNISDKAIAFALTDYIYKNYETERLTAASVAAEFGVSVPEMNRLLLYYNEMNFDTLLNSTRINKACEMLVSTDYLVIDVAVAVGYSNIKTFNMNFYRFKEMTPTEFRDRITLQRTDGSETHGKGRGARRRTVPVRAPETAKETTE